MRGLALWISFRGVGKRLTGVGLRRYGRRRVLAIHPMLSAEVTFPLARFGRAAVIAAAALAACRSDVATDPGAPLVAGVAEAIAQQRVTPEYLVPRDSQTAKLLASFARERGIRLQRPVEPSRCPWSKSTGPTAYSVEIRIDSLRGDEAIGRYQLWCSSRGLRSGFSTGGSARLRRRNGTWSVGQWLDRWIT